MFDLDLGEDSVCIEDQIVRQPVSKGFQHAPAAFQRLQNRGLFGYVPGEFCAHTDPAELSPTSYQTAPPRRWILTQAA
jgi:hypothetical protein